MRNGGRRRCKSAVIRAMIRLIVVLGLGRGVGGRARARSLFDAVLVALSLAALGPIRVPTGFVRTLRAFRVIKLFGKVQQVAPCAAPAAAAGLAGGVSLRPYTSKNRDS